MNKRAAVFARVSRAYRVMRRAMLIEGLTGSRETTTLMLAHFALHFGLTGEEILAAFGDSLMMDLAHLGLFEDEAFANLWAVGPNRK